MDIEIIAFATLAYIIFNYYIMVRTKLLIFREFLTDENEI